MNGFSWQPLHTGSGNSSQNCIWSTTYHPLIWNRISIEADHLMRLGSRILLRKVVLEWPARVKVFFDSSDILLKQKILLLVGMIFSFTSVLTSQMNDVAGILKFLTTDSYILTRSSMASLFLIESRYLVFPSFKCSPTSQGVFPVNPGMKLHLYAVMIRMVWWMQGSFMR